MGKSINNKNLFILSDFNVRSNNRGTAALGYGAISFLLEKGYIDKTDEIVNYKFYRNPFRKCPQHKIEELEVNGTTWKLHTLYVCAIEKWLYKYKLHLFNSDFKNTIPRIKVVAAINGGDGLTDLYGEKLLNSRLPEMNLAIEFNIPFVVMPQTIGPFLTVENKKRINSILKKAKKIYVRDNNYIEELDKAGILYEKTNDLSFYMKPQPFEIDIKHKCVGVNVSGLAYSNKFGNLVGQFDNYPTLMTEIVRMFQRKGCYVYIIPHSYNVDRPEINNDDMEASKLFYASLNNKTGVHLIDSNLISPQLKYLISQMDFFIGTRMHANFAAIFTGVPLFGLAYSYKFKGAFANNGILDRTYEINNLLESDIVKVVSIIERAYESDVKPKSVKNG